MGYEEKLKRRERSKIARRCWEEIIKRAEEGRELSRWEKERVEFLSERGVSPGEEDEMEGKSKMWRLRKREKELQRKERWERIKESRFNVWYKMIKGESVLGYLKKD